MKVDPDKLLDDLREGLAAWHENWGTSVPVWAIHQIVDAATALDRALTGGYDLPKAWT
ncbi:hypothetical protein SEA_FRANCIS47_87 [Mycobacterium phage Francis47]|nr:hypothetical protein SEA_FRANCIS47_87 [Mycobacterium phage Francis47]